MILRTVLVKLKDEWATPEGRAEVSAHGAAALAAVPGVVEAQGMVPADDAALASWDVMFQVRFASMEDVEPYRVHPDHLTFLNGYLSPRAEVKKVWNWSL
jgi:hypothetical protein